MRPRRRLRSIHQQWLVALDRVDIEQSLAALRALVAGVVPATGT
ncbi:hypothetical protein [Micromonospora sp. NPDC002717]